MMPWNAEVARIRCPYCHVGTGFFSFQRHTSGAVNANPDSTCFCDTCKSPRGTPNEFKVQVMVGFRGVGLDYRFDRPGLELHPAARPG